MKFTVVWKPEAERSLTAIWMSARDRQRVEEAVAEIDRLLTRDPTNAGEERSSDLRILFVDPLGAMVRVDTDDRLVEVASVWRLPNRRRRN